jgi:glutathione S-transferase
LSGENLMDITVFGRPPTRALRVIWMLEEMGLAYRVRPVDFLTSAKDPEFLAANPAGLIPAMTDGELSMAESGAMLQYLAARYGPTPLAPPPDSADFPLFLQFLHFGEASLLGPMNVVVASRFRAPEEHKANWGAQAAADMCVSRTALAVSQLAKTPYLAGKEFTAADISVGYGLHVMGLLGLADRLDPSLEDYLARLRERPAFQRAAAA